MSRFVTSPSAFETTTLPLLISERRVVLEIAIKALFIFIPEVFSAISMAFLREVIVSLG